MSLSQCNSILLYAAVLQRKDSGRQTRRAGAEILHYCFCSYIHCSAHLIAESLLLETIAIPKLVCLSHV